MGDAKPQEGPSPRSLDSAPRNGAMLRLWVRYPEGGSWTPLEDARESWTVGFNNFDNTEDDRWQIVGWCWSHDHLVEAASDVEVLGWLPFHGEADPSRREADLLEANNRYLQRTRDAEAEVAKLRKLHWALVQTREILARLHFAEDDAGFDESRDQGVRIADKALAAISGVPADTKAGAT